MIAAGSTIFAIGAAWWALAVGIRPDYVGEALGGMLLTGIGVGLTLPTMMATGASSLPPASFATGSAVVNMFRQIGLAIGVAVFIAVLGSPHSPAAALTAYERSWVVVAVISLVAAAAGLLLLTQRRSTAAATAEPAVAVAQVSAPGRGI